MTPQSAGVQRVYWNLPLYPLLLISIIHVFLFPLASISTWESKPRGFYIDENSLSSAINIGMATGSDRLEVSYSESSSPSELETTSEDFISETFVPRLDSSTSSLIITQTDHGDRSLMSCVSSTLRSPRESSKRLVKGGDECVYILLLALALSLRC